jgi:hypothetical protein
MTEPSSEIVITHGLISGIGIGELNRDMWEPLPFEPLVAEPSPEVTTPTTAPPADR